MRSCVSDLAACRRGGMISDLVSDRGDRRLA
jgi:hypothetical protein